jgi:hypothetical protein
MTILAWKNTSPTRVSHYLAGDALWQQETALVNWLALSCDVANVKISHHGAAKSSPVTLFQGLNPITAIVSAGTEHGHPRKSIPCTNLPFYPFFLTNLFAGWELLLWLYGWRLASNLGARFTGLVPICYPYYLVLDQEKNPYTHYRFSVDALDRVPTGSRSKELISFQAYQAALSALPEFSAPNEPTFVSVFQDATAGLKDVRRKRGIIQRFLSKAWPVLSEDVGGKFHPFRKLSSCLYIFFVQSTFQRTETIRSIISGCTLPELENS